jgi:protein involved in polysaccharide export with SLBB domain
MKSSLLLFVLLLVVPSLTAAQTQTRERRSGDREILPTSDSSGVRNRVVGQSRSANHVEKQQGTPAEESATLQTTGANSQSNPLNQKAGEPRWGNTSVIIRPVENKSTAPPVALATNEKRAVERTNKPITKLVQPTAIIAEVKPAKRPILSNPNIRSAAPLRVPLATAVYLVGKGDVLDIRLANMPTRESTLYTVLKNGLVEYPLLNGPINVVGLSTDEIAKLLSTQIKVIQAARVSVSIRDYASHGVVVTGLVDSPGRKILRREAMPLYTVLAEALPRPEATLATLVRGGKTETVPLDNEQAMSTLVVPGDIIKVSADSVNAKGFVYVGGNVTSPGEKEFRDGMTLTQVLISAGGTRSTGKATAKVARRNANGFLSTNEYNLHSIADGKAQDPLLQAGDRIDVAGGE